MQRILVCTGIHFGLVATTNFPLRTVPQLPESQWRVTKWYLCCWSGNWDTLEKDRTHLLKLATDSTNEYSNVLLEFDVQRDNWCPRSFCTSSIDINLPSSTRLEAISLADGADCTLLSSNNLSAALILPFRAKISLRNIAINNVPTFVCWMFCDSSCRPINMKQCLLWGQVSIRWNPKEIQFDLWRKTCSLRRKRKILLPEKTFEAWSETCNLPRNAHCDSWTRQSETATEWHRSACHTTKAWCWLRPVWHRKEPGCFCREASLCAECLHACLPNPRDATIHVHSPQSTLLLKRMTQFKNSTFNQICDWIHPITCFSTSREIL